MPQLLKRAVDNILLDPIKDKQTSYKANDVVKVFDDTWVPGEIESGSRFQIDQVSGAVEDWLFLLEQPPASLRRKYPRSMMAHRRLRTVMGRGVKEARLFTRLRKFKYTTEVVRKPQEER